MTLAVSSFELGATQHPVHLTATPLSLLHSTKECQQTAQGPPSLTSCASQAAPAVPHNSLKTLLIFPQLCFSIPTDGEGRCVLNGYRLWSQNQMHLLTILTMQYENVADQRQKAEGQRTGPC